MTPIRDSGRFVPGINYSETTQFKPGNPLGIATRFKAGQAARNKLPIGSVTIRDRKGVQRAFVKIAEPNVWRKRATVVWEAVNGKRLPRGYVVHHKDRNALNDDSSNLVALTRSQHIAEHRSEFSEARRGRKDSHETRQRKREAQLRRYARERETAS